MVRVDGKLAEFDFFCPGVEAVYLAGDFNDWREDELAMDRGTDGHWRTRIELTQGEFCFRYIADGLWYTDFAANGIEPGPFGYNSVVSVSS